MAQTPEGKVKKKVSQFLSGVPGIYYDMPVPGGYGASTLDYVGCYLGRFFAIETKKPGARPTPRQEQIISMMRRAGAEVFVVDGTVDYPLEQVREWMTALANSCNTEPQK